VSISFRPYAGETDYAAMRTLLVSICGLIAPPVYCTIGDLDWWRCNDDDPDAAMRAGLWLDGDGELAGFAWPGRTQVDLVSHPRYRDLDQEMLAWAESRRRAEAAAETQPVLEVWAYERDRRRRRMLEGRGYEQGEGCLTFNALDLDCPVVEPAPPPGYTLRTVRGEELEPRVAVHRDAFAPSRMNVAKYRAVMASPTYRPDLDLVAVAPDGALAAFCIVWFDEVNRIGVFEPVGCHPEHRRQGLAAAVMGEGLRRLVALGARTAWVCAWADNAASTRLYASLGFRTIDRCCPWRRTLS